MKKKELEPIFLSEDPNDYADILGGTYDTDDVYIPEVSCSGVGGAACKPGCYGGCFNSSKKGNCTSCQTGCEAGCSNGCMEGCKSSSKVKS